MSRKKMLRLVQGAIILYCLVGIAFYYAQDYIFFRPVPLTRSHRYNFQLPYREINLDFDALSNINIIQFQTDHASPAGVVLYFHGNRRNISWYARHAPMFTKQGFELWMIDYPGYGKSTGRLEEEVLYAYARQLYKLARKRFSADSIILYGRSMGTGIAAQLASIEPARRLILETPYYSLPSLAAHYLPIYPMRQIVRMKMPTYEYISSSQCPLYILHGTADWVIPLRNAEKLKRHFRQGDGFYIVKGATHNNLQEFPEFRRKVDSLLSAPAH